MKNSQEMGCYPKGSLRKHFYLPTNRLRFRGLCLHQLTYLHTTHSEHYGNNQRDEYLWIGGHKMAGRTYIHSLLRQSGICVLLLNQVVTYDPCPLVGHSYKGWRRMRRVEHHDRSPETGERGYQNYPTNVAGHYSDHGGGIT